MRQMLNAGAGQAPVMDLHPWHVKAAVCHAVLSQRFRDALLSSATVLTVSLFTVVTIVAIVTAVNSSLNPVDLWSRWTSPPVVDMTEPAPSAAELAAWLQTTEQATPATAPSGLAEAHAAALPAAAE